MVVRQYNAQQNIHESIQWMYTFHLMHSDLWMLCLHRWDMKKGGVGFAASKPHPASGATVSASFD